ncbi:MAG: homoserine O-succinyltransferase [Alphaproteobacteria bacterium]|nr:homoserine O-succinyltransferase [Alphaproteobacteria bacterium]
MRPRLHNFLGCPTGGWAVGEEENVLRIGLLNNMPDAALECAERQFGNLLSAAAPNLNIRWYLFTLRSIPRTTEGNLHLLRQYYGGMMDLFRTPLDAIVVTGTEPQQPDLRQEPYWSDLAMLFDWVDQERVPALFSCLAAHAAVLHYSGIPRQRLPQKRLGLFEHAAVARHPLTASMTAPVRVAHSRWNELPVEALGEEGYRILTYAPEAGADLFVPRNRDDLLFHQGHPEYDADTLAREYRRDVKRFLAGCADSYPDCPKNYFGAGEHEALGRFREKAMHERDERLMDFFPQLTPGRNQQPPPMASLMASWLERIDRRKAERPGVVSARRSELAHAL